VFGHDTKNTWKSSILIRGLYKLFGKIGGETALVFTASGSGNARLPRLKFIRGVWLAKEGEEPILNQKIYAAMP